MSKVRIKDTKLAYGIGSKFTNSLEQHQVVVQMSKLKKITSVCKFILIMTLPGKYLGFFGHYCFINPLSHQ